MLKLFLQRIRFNLRNVFAKKITIPSRINNFEYSYPNYHELLLSYLLTNLNNEVNYSKKIFGKETDNYLTSKDIFNDIDFKSHNKYIPAYFNKGDVKVPYEASRLQYFQKLDLLSILKKEHNKKYYDIIKAFKDLTGVGALLNTSLNLHGLPIAMNYNDTIYLLISDLSEHTKNLNANPNASLYFAQEETHKIKSNNPRLTLQGKFKKVELKKDDPIIV